MEANAARVRGDDLPQAVPVALIAAGMMLEAAVIDRWRPAPPESPSVPAPPAPAAPDTSTDSSVFPALSVTITKSWISSDSGS